MLMAMLIVVVATMMVIGAISFTGNERAAASSYERRAAMSACVQAARNLFLSRTRVFNAGGAGAYSLDSKRTDYNAARRLNEDMRVSKTDATAKLNISSRHYSGTNPTTGTGNVVYSVSEAPEGSFPPETSTGTGGITNILGGRGQRARQAFKGTYYVISAVCQDSAGGPEQEVEFTVRLGL